MNNTFFKLLLTYVLALFFTSASYSMDQKNTSSITRNDVLKKMKEIIDNDLNSLEEIHDQGYTTLHVLCIQGVSSLIEYITNKNITPHRFKEIFSKKNTVNGFTPLHCACLHDHVAIIEIIANKFPTIFLELLKQENNNHKSPLSISLSENRKKVIKFLINKFPNIFIIPFLEAKKTSLDTLIIEYITETDPYLFTELLQIQDNNGNTLLHLACGYQNNDTIDKIAHADLDLDLLLKLLQVKNKKNRTPLDIAIKKNYGYFFTKIFNIKDDEENTLLHHLCLSSENFSNSGESSSNNNENSFNIITLIAHHNFNFFSTLLSSKNSDGETPFHFICSSDKLYTIIELIAKNDLNLLSNLSSLKTDDGETPLHYACDAFNENTIKFFIDKHFNCFTMKTNESNTPLHFICSNYSENCSTIIELIANQGLNTFLELLSLKNNDNKTPLLLLEEDGDKIITKFISSLIVKLFAKEKNSDPIIALAKNDPQLFSELLDTVLDNGTTLLYFACGFKKSDLVTLIAEKAPEKFLTLLNQKDSKGRTPFDIAWYQGSHDIIKIALNVGTQEDLFKLICNKNLDGETYLHSACRYGYKTIIELIVNQYAQDVEVLFLQKNNKKQTPLGLAVKHRHKNLVTYLTSTYPNLNEQCINILFKLLDTSDKKKITHTEIN